MFNKLRSLIVHNSTAMSVTVDTTATEQIVRDLVDASAVNANGTRWNAVSSIPQLQTSAAKLPNRRQGASRYRNH